MDIKGNNFIKGNSEFQLKPPVSGNISAEKSLLNVTPKVMIPDGKKTALINLQAKDSLGQNFFEGGYQVKIFGPTGELKTVDNKDGTYSAEFTPNKISIDGEIIFLFKVADIFGNSSVSLKLFSDQDSDGIKDTEDKCPNTSEGLDVDDKGCALSQKDTDGDGVFDDLDECPDTKSIEDLEFNFKNPFTADVTSTLFILDNSADQNSFQTAIINFEIDEKDVGQTREIPMAMAL